MFYDKLVEQDVTATQQIKFIGTEVSLPKWHWREKETILLPWRHFFALTAVVNWVAFTLNSALIVASLLQRTQQKDL